MDEARDFKGLLLWKHERPDGTFDGVFVPPFRMNGRLNKMVVPLTKMQCDTLPLSGAYRVTRTDDGTDMLALT